MFAFQKIDSLSHDILLLLTMAKFNLTSTLSKFIDELAVFILEDVLSIRPVTDSCYASSVKREIALLWSKIIAAPGPAEMWLTLQWN